MGTGRVVTRVRNVPAWWVELACSWVDRACRVGEVAGWGGESRGFGAMEAWLVARERLGLAWLVATVWPETACRNAGREGLGRSVVKEWDDWACQIGMACQRLVAPRLVE